MTVFGKIGAASLALTLIATSASVTMAAPRHAGAHVASHHGYTGHRRYAHRGGGAAIAAGALGLLGAAAAGAAANSYYSDGYYGGPAYGYYGAPAYGYYRGYY